MYSKQNRSKYVGVALFVLVASFVLVGGVAARHGSGPVHASRNTGVRFAAYMDVLDADALWSFDIAWVPVQPVPAARKMGVRYEAYIDAMDPDMRRSFDLAWVPEEPVSELTTPEQVTLEVTDSWNLYDLYRFGGGGE